MIQIRTDLAVETSEKIHEERTEMKGVSIHKEQITSEITKTVVHIETENGAKQMGKPKGRYLTIEAANMTEEDEGYHREISKEISKALKDFLPDKKKEIKILVVGLGNRETTPDSLGPRVVDNLFITRHLIKEFGEYLIEFEKSMSVSGIVPGVMAQTGMESVEIIKGIVKETKPDIVIVIDALAARNVKRLNRTIQITDTGIVPGSGVGNYRNAINKENLGVPVVAIGVPTVVDAATIVADTFQTMLDVLSIDQSHHMLKKQLEELNEAEQEELIRELITPKMNTMYVTPKDIDESVKRLSYTISEGLNMTFLDGKGEDMME